MPSRLGTAFLCALFALLTALPSGAGRKKDADEAFRFRPGTDRFELRHEWRAAWLTTVHGTDWPDADDDAATQQEKLVTMIRDLKELGINVVFFQTVSNQDAVYPSAILPWSNVLTGKQGKDPGYDPLALAVSTCRENGLQIHAWINPFRCGPVKSERDPKHVVLAHPEWIQTYRKGYYLDPALPGVRDYLASIVTELLTRYDLDGIHLDDYFYPEGLQADKGNWNDDKAWRRYGKGTKRETWRYANVDTVVRALSQATHAAKPTAVFGISPAGRLVNTLKIYADPRSWAKDGTVDYLIPQIYWNHGHPIADFPTVLAGWEEIVGNVPMFTGLGAYRYGDKGFESLEEFDAQVKASRNAPYVFGHAWFPSKTILREDFREHLKEGAYRWPSLVPKIGESDGVVPAAPHPRVSGDELNWQECEGATGYAVYELVRSEEDPTLWEACLVMNGNHLSFKGKEHTNYIVVAYAGKEKSAFSELVFIPSKKK